ncbi:TPA: hypothetical protein R1721_001212 [Campylobacter lari]|nr:hypothetical protein [Campylobacter lari]
MSVDMSSKIDELAHNIGEVINRADALMDKFEKNEGDIAGIEEKLEKAATTDKDNSFSGNNSFEKPISIPEATKENEGINLGQADDRYAKLLNAPITWTVGSGGNFNTLQEALLKVSEYKNKGNVFINIKILKNHTISYPVKLENVNLGLVVLLGEDDSVINVDYNQPATTNGNIKDFTFKFTLVTGLIWALKINCVTKTNTLYATGSSILFSEKTSFNNMAGFYFYKTHLEFWYGSKIIGDDCKLNNIGSQYLDIRDSEGFLDVKINTTFNGDYRINKNISGVFYLTHLSHRSRVRLTFQKDSELTINNGPNYINFLVGGSNAHIQGIGGEIAYNPTGTTPKNNAKLIEFVEGSKVHIYALKINASLLTSGSLIFSIHQGTIATGTSTTNKGAATLTNIAKGVLTATGDFISNTIN